jgi:hypothetical protein
MRVRYLSSVVSLAIHFFSISSAITLKSIFRMQFWTPMTHSLRSPNNTASYLAILFVHLFFSFVNCNRVAYLSLMSEGDTRIVAALAPALPQAPSQYTYHYVSVTGPSV